MKAQFEDFRVTATYTGLKRAPWSFDGQHQHENWNHHRVTVYNSTTKKRVSFDFWASEACPELRGKYDVLNAFYCFVSDAISGDMGFDEFCREFGYDEDSRRAEKIHKACQESMKKFKSICSDDIYELSNRLSEKYA